MYNYSIGLVLLIFSSLSIAETTEVGKCRIDLTGPEVMPDSILEREDLSVEECKKRAKAILKLNQQYYDKAIVKHSLLKEKIIITNE